MTVDYNYSNGTKRRHICREKLYMENQINLHSSLQYTYKLVCLDILGRIPGFCALCALERFVIEALSARREVIQPDEIVQNLHRTLLLCLLSSSIAPGTRALFCYSLVLQFGSALSYISTENQLHFRKVFLCPRRKVHKTTNPNRCEYLFHVQVWSLLKRNFHMSSYGHQNVVPPDQEAVVFRCNHKGGTSARPSPLTTKCGWAQLCPAPLST